MFVITRNGVRGGRAYATRQEAETAMTLARAAALHFKHDDGKGWAVEPA